MKKVADWQLANKGKGAPTDWVHGVYYTGVMAAWRVTHDAKYLDAMRAMGEANHWKLGPRLYHADDQVVGQSYCEIYAIDHKPEEIAGIQASFDKIMAEPKTGSMDRANKAWQERWAWCDALFMAPPAWVRLAQVTGDKRYLDFMDTNYWGTATFLYDPKEHFFYRDSSYFKKTEANGKPVFWGRGNGWVYAGLARILDVMPADYPSRPKYVQLYREMTDSLLAVQQSDGLWRMSLLDPGPDGESSSSGLILYGLAWGVNHGILDKAKYSEPVLKGWSALCGHVHDDGKLGWIQPVGEAPGKVGPDSTDLFGVGAFLLAGSEVYHLVGGQ